MYFTIPVTITKAKRPFSKLKLFKNYVRSTMGQKRLINLALLLIENDIAQNIYIDKVINDFDSKKVRKQRFM